MAIYDMSRPAGDALSTRIATRLVQVAYALVDGMKARRTSEVLSRLTDDELFDIGLSRADIRRMARRD